MRIAYIALKGLPIGGGIEKWTEEVGSRLVLRGHDILVYSSRDYGSVDGIYKGMNVLTVPSINTKSLHKLSICLSSTIDVCRHRNVDVIHFHAVGPSVFAIFPRLIGLPTVVQTHGLEWKRDKWGALGKLFFKLADYTAVYFPDATTSVSLVQKRFYEHKFGRKIVYIPTGVGRPKLRPAKWLREQGLEPNRYILFAARLVEEKGAHFLIQAYRKLRPELKLVIAGDAEHAENYKSELRRLAEANANIIFPGFVTGEPLEELFSNAYLFCLPSTIEGLPIALLEAMSYGNCCLVSDIPENCEALQGIGFTFASRNVENLTTVLGDLISSPSKVSAIKSSARNHVIKRYSWDLIVDEIETFYEKVVGKAT